jgi:hypothetical protein
MAQKKTAPLKSANYVRTGRPSGANPYTVRPQGTNTVRYPAAKKAP